LFERILADKCKAYAIYFSEAYMIHTRKSPYLLLTLVSLMIMVMLIMGFNSAPTQAGGTPVWPTIVPVALTPTFTQPTSMTNAGDGSGRLFVVEKNGYIRIISNGEVLPTPFLDIDALVTSTGIERGLLGLAFSPNYTTNGQFYVYYTDNSNNIVTARYKVSTANPDVADSASAQIVFTIPHPEPNHFGGQLAFGPDGMLYMGPGDGTEGDTANNGQNTNVWLGKILRLNVEIGNPITYTIPADNPFVGQPGYKEEIWQLGLRNPWRFAFDSVTGDMFMSDVGQSAREEINWQSADSAGGENWGWRCYEGNAPYNTSGCQPQSAYDAPIYEYPHSGGRCSITGGDVYRGSLYPRMQGIYFYADWCSGELFGLQYFNNEWISQPLYDFSGNPNTFGVDDDGTLYMALHGGTVYRLTDPGGGGTATPTVSPTLTSTPVPPTPTATPTIVPSTGTPTATATVTLTPVPSTFTPTATTMPPSATPTATILPPTSTATTTPIPPSPTATPTPTESPPTMTATPTGVPPLRSLYLPSIQRE
jgi:glucose/arabinose dehydrogenase